VISQNAVTVPPYSSQYDRWYYVGARSPHVIRKGRESGSYGPQSTLCPREGDVYEWGGANDRNTQRSVLAARSGVRICWAPTAYLERLSP